MTTTCWVCCEPIEDPPEIVGWFTIHAGIRDVSIAHIACLHTIYELELDFQRADGPTGPDLGGGPGRS